MKSNPREKEGRKTHKPGSHYSFMSFFVPSQSLFLSRALVRGNKMEQNS